MNSYGRRENSGRDKKGRNRKYEEKGIENFKRGSDEEDEC